MKRAFVLVAIASACGGGAKTIVPCDPALALTASECTTLNALRLPSVLPASRGNAVADDDAAAQLGFKLFFRRNIGHGSACASCHEPELAFTDHLNVAVANGSGTRNTPTVFNAARLQVFFWDGRADSLWSQPLFAIENPVEMASSRLELVQTIAADVELSGLYATAFGSALVVDNLPATGKPGDPAWDTLDVATQTRVNRDIANLGKSLDAYLRKNTSGDSDFDRYLDGNSAALPALAKQGIVTFLRGGCLACHATPMFTDQKFYALEFPNSDGAPNDPGRATGATILAQNPFNLAGAFADGNFPVDASDMTVGGFRTPSLRNVQKTQPYGHAGTFGTLSALLATHAATATDDERGALLAFIQTLNGDYPELPWSDWPQPQ